MNREQASEGATPVEITGNYQYQKRDGPTPDLLAIDSRWSRIPQTGPSIWPRSCALLPNVHQVLELPRTRFVFSWSRRRHRIGRTDLCAAKASSYRNVLSTADIRHHTRERGRYSFENLFRSLEPDDRARLVEALFRQLQQLDPSDGYKLLVLLAEAGGSIQSSLRI